MGVATADQQKMIDGFKALREQQQQLIAEVSRVESELREHRNVLESLESMEDSRRCYRQIGDTMVEHTAKEMVEMLKNIVNRFKDRGEEVCKELVAKDAELEAYKEKNGIRFMSEQEVVELQKKRILEELGKMNMTKAQK